jgi:hypothetical protein
MTYLMAPGYMTPFLYHPVARTIALSLLAWSIIGWLFAWYVPIGSRVKFGAVVGTALMLCTVPLLVMPMIGPSTTGIMQAMGPVIADRNF